MVKIEKFLKYNLIDEIYFFKHPNWCFFLNANNIDDKKDDNRPNYVPNNMRARLRVIHPRINYYLHEAIFRQSFRVDQTVFIQIEQYIGRYLVNNQRNHALSPRQKILTALHFLGNGCQYHVNGQTHTISKSTVFRCIHRICRLI